MTEFLHERRWWSIFRKAPDRKPLFLLKIKIKQNPGCSNNQHNVVLKHFRQNTRAYPRSKKNLHWPMIGKMLHIGKNLSKARCWQKSLVCPKCSLGILGELQCQENFAIFPLFLTWEQHFQHLNWQEIVIWNAHLFFMKTSNLIINWVPLSPLQTYCAC